jgi:hemerythrin-like metal-binding protein
MPFPDSRDAALLVGIPSIDSEHAELMSEIGRLIGPPAVSLDSERFSEIVSRLGRQLAEHFEHEEAIIEECGLPADEVAAHRRAHREILEQYTMLQFDLMSRTALDPAVVFAMIRSWIVGHLIAYDMRLRLFAPSA